MVQFTLRRAVPQDASAIAHVHFSAFTHDPISHLCFPRGASSLKFWTEIILEEIEEPEAEFWVVYDADASSPPLTGEENEKGSLAWDEKEEKFRGIIAYAKWVPPSAPIPAPSTPLPTWPQGADTTTANTFFGALLANRHRHMSGRRHWFLELLCTRLEWQRRGAAGLLLRYGIGKADADRGEDGEGCECYLEASPAGRPVYEKYGYVEVGRMVMDLSERGLERFEEVPVRERGEMVECFMKRPKGGRKA